MLKYIVGVFLATLIVTGVAVGSNNMVTSTTHALCVYVDRTHGGASAGDISVLPKYHHRVCIVGRRGPRGAAGTAGANGAAGPAGPQGATGATGATGPAGPQGATGPQGPSGVSNVQADTPYGQDVLPNPGLVQSDDTIPAGATQSVWVMCHEGQTALGGGFILGGPGDYVSGGSDNGAVILSSLPAYVEDGALSYNAPITNQDIGSFRPNAWAVSVHNPTDGPIVVRPSIICATVDQ